MSFEVLTGKSLFDPSNRLDALAQGVNAQGIMGAGIAVDFREKWPAMYQDYKEVCSVHGSYLPGLIHTWFNDPGEPVIFNLFTQDFPGRGRAQLGWLAQSVYLMRQHAELLSLDRVGLPWIGCGIGGIEKHNALHFFERILSPSHIEFVLVER